MKTPTVQPCVAMLFAVSALTSSLFAGGPVNTSKSKVLLPREEREEFGTFFNLRPYSETLGLSLWNTSKLYEGRRKTLLGDEKNRGDKVKIGEDLAKRMNKKLESMAAENNGQLFTDYSKMGYGTTLEFEQDNSFALLFRLRQKFQMLNEDSKDATFTYIDDRKINDSGSHIEAAAMLDWYLPFLYSSEAAWDGFWVKRAYRLTIRTGFEINKNDLPGIQKLDQQKWYGLLTFQANPDQQARFLNIDGLEITSPQIVQLGAVYEQNRISGNEDWHWIAGWSPIMKLENGFGLNKRMMFSKNDAEKAPAVAAHQDDAQVNQAKHNDGWYWSIDPSFNALGASDARGAVRNLGKIRSLKGLQDLRGEQATWALTARVGYDDGLFELSYTVTGAHPFSDLGNSHIGQEVRADFNLAKLSSIPKKDWRSLSAYVSYKRGELEPNFEDVDLVTAGVAVRF